MQVFLETERLVLRRFTEADVDNLFELDSDPEVMRWLSGGTPTPREYIEEVVLPGFLAADERRPWLGVWALEQPDAGFLGWVSLRPVAPETPTWAVLGYRLRMPDHKRAAVQAFKSLRFRTVAAGDSYNDVPMLTEAHAGIFFHPPQNIAAQFPQFPVTRSYQELEAAIVAAAAQT